MVECLREVKQMSTEEREETEQENNLRPLVNGSQELAALHARIKLKRLYPSLESQVPSLQEDNVANLV